MIEKIYFKQAKSASFVPIKIKATQKLIKSGFGEDTFLVKTCPQPHGLDENGSFETVWGYRPRRVLFSISHANI